MDLRDFPQNGLRARVRCADVLTSSIPSDSVIGRHIFAVVYLFICDRELHPRMTKCKRRKKDWGVSSHSSSLEQLPELVWRGDT